MLVVAKSPVCEDGEQCENRGQPSSWHAFAAVADLFVDQRKQCGENQAQRENEPQDGLDNENDVPGNPAFGERPERAYSIVVGEVEENVAEPRQAGGGEQQSPARRKIGIAGLASAQTPDEIDVSNDHGGHKRDAQEGLSAAAVMV